MADHDWNAAYVAGELPWDTGYPSEHLVEMVQSGALPRGRALEVGCGTGTNAVWLAEQGYEVLAVDLSPVAVERAIERAAEAGVSDSFEARALDFLADDVPGPFDLVFDRGCFHCFDDDDDRARFAAAVARALAPSGVWLSLIGSTDGAPRDSGPPRRTAREVLNAIEPVLELTALRSTVFAPNEEDPKEAWLCLSRVREIPAQPSTRRS